jgi:hypothetical protein
MFRVGERAVRPPWRRDEFARRLRTHRAPPRDEFVSSVASRVRGADRPPATSRPALAVALSVAVIVAVGALGGVGYADSAAHQVASEVRQAVSAPGAATLHRQLTPADTQYCHGDDCLHHHRRPHQQRHHHHHRGQTPG